MAATMRRIGRSHAPRLTVRTVTEDDRAQWETLWRGYNAFYERRIPAKTTDATWSRFFDTAEPVHALVAEQDDRLVGLVHYVFHRSTSLLGPTCYLQDLFTVRDLRRQGVGRALIEAVYERARRGGARVVYWHTHESNATAMSLWGARLLSLQAPDGRWGGGAAIPDSISTNHTLWLLRVMGLDPTSDEARKAIARVRDVRWEYDEKMRFFEGEVEPCINGTAVAVGAYFGEDVRGIVERLLSEQMADGGWNCDQERGSTRGSFHTTICVLEGLLEYERTTGGSPAATAARERGQEYLLERRMLRRLSTGEVADPGFTQFPFPPGWHYDVLRGLDHLRAAGVTPDDRMSEAIAVVEAKRDADGRWPLETPQFKSAHRLQGKVHFAMDEGVGRPSRWNTLRALRVLRWATLARRSAVDSRTE